MPPNQGRAAGLAAMSELSEAVLAVARHLDTSTVLRTILRSARELVGAEYAALGVPDGAGSFARFLVEGVSDEQWRRIGPLPRQHGMLGVMMQDPHPQRLADITADPRFNWWPAAHPQLRGFLGVPIRDGQEILGALFLGNTDPDGVGEGECFTQEDEAVLEILAAHAAIALTHARLYERERELAITTERARLARELHDAVAQKLFALRLTVQAAQSLIETEPTRAREQLAQVGALATEAATELSTAVGELRAPDLAGDGLAETLRKQVAVVDRAHAAHGGPRVAFRCCPPPHLPPTHDQVVLRVAQEALHNALRHAHAQRIDLSLCAISEQDAEAEHFPGGARLVVRDDGVGFDAGTSGRGLGLVSMRERADSVGGRLTVRAKPGEGTVIELEVPGGRG
ncbi:GAF domain-containing sensor histidine kinase [Actinospica durhamensis]|uniref:Oxygen sensor histidine kinase NreB n=1 Tax=Actinospica durhamensis TaxID=1508375 RepID=A0A941EL06_9ACTN|nr:GAF domain-containing sensor histidine kinase [Actinospica durhamensis]MBR7832823.1 GAF domain-containing sensor histidine kinase [Actinospica durhamensis]